MRRAALATLFSLCLAGGATAFDYHRDRPAPKDGFSYPDCYCTNRGERVALGATACLHVGGRRFTARCAMSLNNPAWREVEDGCAPEGLSRALPSSAPASRG
jgi:hypothetical protein